MRGLQAGARQCSVAVYISASALRGMSPVAWGSPILWSERTLAKKNNKALLFLPTSSFQHFLVLFAGNAPGRTLRQTGIVEQAQTQANLRVGNAEQQKVPNRAEVEPSLPKQDSNVKSRKGTVTHTHTHFGAYGLATPEFCETKV